jgi:hypothetical protein
LILIFRLVICFSAEGGSSKVLKVNSEFENEMKEYKLQVLEDIESKMTMESFRLMSINNMENVVEQEGKSLIKVTAVYGKVEDRNDLYQQQQELNYLCKEYSKSLVPTLVNKINELLFNHYNSPLYNIKYSKSIDQIVENLRTKKKFRFFKNIQKTTNTWKKRIPLALSALHFSSKKIKKEKNNEGVQSTSQQNISDMCVSEKRFEDIMKKLRQLIENKQQLDLIKVLKKAIPDQISIILRRHGLLKKNESLTYDQKEQLQNLCVEFSMDVDE